MTLLHGFIISQVMAICLERCKLINQLSKWTQLSYVLIDKLASTSFQNLFIHIFNLLSGTLLYKPYSLHIHSHCPPSIIVHPNFALDYFPKYQQYLLLTEGLFFS